ncbi:pantoate--beta-alanine ligase [Sulfurimonas sp.]|jgi:pantoate--beta-alanine ligase|uniref:pantoate--beta-alanine ligase n=1 Tax=Sulfurimonas sp. TaxID=2022749 RepID=UPI0025F3881A|nr:pantoate--beta-alanine ligase [Sulfurimonas sp.]MBT5934763.1 pantoate--beta-alanine ligase [Sulfurimonas sp.]
MRIISKVRELKEYLKEQNKIVGLVPTMGALHDGHLSLIKNAKKECELVVVSIFVNPTQFLKGEDLDKYPSRDKADKKICELSGVDVIFLPQADEIYGDDEVKVLAPNIRGFTLEGASRPGHFNGVLTVVNKLFNIVNPDFAYFGKKDAQQLNLISLMVEQFFMNVVIVPVDTVRESDGLALSSRNIYLCADQRIDALKISSSLYEASKMVSRGDVQVDDIKRKMSKVLEPLEISYVEILSRDFKATKRVEIGNSIVLVEVLVGTTRLLDNIWL